MDFNVHSNNALVVLVLWICDYFHTWSLFFVCMDPCFTLWNLDTVTYFCLVLTR